MKHEPGDLPEFHSFMTSGNEIMERRGIVFIQIKGFLHMIIIIKSVCVKARTSIDAKSQAWQSWAAEPYTYARKLRLVLAQLRDWRALSS
nr:hypothetical protein [Evansella caseinilytica]